jgi:hypothetical protein
MSSAGAGPSGRRKQASRLGPVVRRFPAATAIVGESTHSAAYLEYMRDHGDGAGALEGTVLFCRS